MENSNFHLAPHGWRRHESEGKFKVSLIDDEYEVYENARNGIEVEYKILKDDYGNGEGEIHLSNCEINGWKIEYIRFWFSWNSTGYFATVTDGNTGHSPFTIGGSIPMNNKEKYPEAFVIWALKVLKSELDKTTSFEEMVKLAYGLK